MIVWLHAGYSLYAVKSTCRPFIFVQVAYGIEPAFSFSFLFAAACQRSLRIARYLPPADPMRLLLLLLLFSTSANSASSWKQLKGNRGGNWSPCTHLVAYGLNAEPRYAKALAVLFAQARGATALEFGCGLGLYSSYLARFGGVSGDVVGVEPDPRFHKIWASMGLLAEDGLRPRQAAVDITHANVSELRAHGLDRSYDLVHSNEVVEHIPVLLHSRVFDFLAARTSTLLIFGMARPKQPGHGHIACRSPQSVQYELTHRGLRHLPNISRALRQIGLAPWAHNRAAYTKDPSFLDEPSAALLALAHPPRFTTKMMFDKVNHSFEREHWPHFLEYEQKLKKGAVQCDYQ